MFPGLPAQATKRLVARFLACLPKQPGDGIAHFLACLPKQPSDAQMQNMIAMIQQGANIETHFASAAGVARLTEENLDKFTEALGSVKRLASELPQNKEFDEWANLGKRERSEVRNLEETIATGDFSGVTHLAQRFRDEHPKDTAQYDRTPSALRTRVATF